MEKKLYTVRIKNYPLSQNIGTEETFYTDDIEHTISEYSKNRSPFKWEVVGVTNIDGLDEFDKKPI